MFRLNQGVFFVAEMSANHNGSFERAKRIVIEAAKSGANAVKFQTYTADTMTLDSTEFRVDKNQGIWSGKKLYDLYKEAYTPWEWHKELFDLCYTLNIIPFSTPFDTTSLEFLESINCPMYKIASLETGDFKLIESVAKTMKPMIVSTGATEWAEISELLNLIASTGNSKIILLLCTSAYPAHPIDLNLLRLQNLKNHFEISVGLSDHTLGIGVSVAAIALGASVIEKHFTISRSDGGLDSAFSLEPLEFRTLVNEGKMAFDSLGNPSWQISKSEIFSRNLRRSLYIIKDVKAGELATEGNIRAIRPNGGCEPKYLKQILGRKFVKDFQKGTPLNLDHLS